MPWKFADRIEYEERYKKEIDVLTSMTGKGSWIEENYEDGWRKRGQENEYVSGRATIRWHPYFWGTGRGLSNTFPARVERWHSLGNGLAYQSSTRGLLRHNA